jgi:hypothetical protein
MEGELPIVNGQPLPSVGKVAALEVALGGRKAASPEWAT